MHPSELRVMLTCSRDAIRKTKCAGVAMYRSPPGSVSRLVACISLCHPPQTSGGLRELCSTLPLAERKVESLAGRGSSLRGQDWLEEI